MRVIFARQAEADIEAIGDYIALDNPARAVSFMRELRTACLGLVDTSQRFGSVPGFEARGLRRRPYGHYSIFYVVGPDAVQVARVLSAARDIDDLFADHASD